jgi:HlyD family secretion protein
MRWRRTFLVLIVTPIFGAPLFLSMREPPVPRVEIALANVPAQPSRLVAAPGFVEPASEVRAISASAPGRLLYMKVGEGDMVTAGEIIAEIENGDLRAQLAAAEANLKVRQNELARLEAGARAQERGEAEAALREATATASLAKIVFDRQNSLRNSGAVSQEAIDRLRADRQAADARRTLLAEKLSLVEAPPRPEDVEIAEARIADAQAGIAETKALIEKTIVRSPIDGVVLRRYKHAGEMVSIQPPTLIAEVGDITKLRVRAEVDEADVGRVFQGQDASITADAYSDRSFHGKVSRVSEIMGPKDFRTDQPGERMDTKVLETLIDLEPGVQLPVGLRVDVLFQSRAEGQLTGSTGRTGLAKSKQCPGHPTDSRAARNAASACAYTDVAGSVGDRTTDVIGAPR